MNYNNMLMAREYILRFDQILDEMASKMTSQQFINNITIDFTRCMIPHHQAAIYMCENLLKYINYKPLEKIAKNIIVMQTKGIEQMKEIERTAIRFNNYPINVECYRSEYNQIVNNMISQMRNSPRCLNINLNFTNEMIPHHKGAVLMCENLLKYRIDPRLIVVAKNIIKEQSNGIVELEQVRNNLCDRMGNNY